MRYFSRSLIFGSKPNNALNKILKDSSVPLDSYKLLASFTKLLISNSGLKATPSNPGVYCAFNLS